MPSMEMRHLTNLRRMGGEFQVLWWICTSDDTLSMSVCQATIPSSHQANQMNSEDLNRTAMYPSALDLLLL